MLRHICFAVCAAILLTNASQARHLDDIIAVDSPPRTTVLPETEEDNFEIHGTIAPGYNIESSQQETDTIPGTTDLSSENESENTETADDSISNYGSTGRDDENLPSGSENPVSSDNSAVENDSESDNVESNNKVEDGDENFFSNLESNESDGESFENIPADAIVLNTVDSVNSVHFTVYSFKKDGVERICQEISFSGDPLEIKCFDNILPSFWTPEYGETVRVFISPRHVDGETFYCQEIISYFKGPLQTLCSSEQEYFFEELPGLLNAHKDTVVVPIL